MGDSEKYAEKVVKKPLITPDVLPIKEEATKRGDMSPPVSLLAMKNKRVENKVDAREEKSVAANLEKTKENVITLVSKLTIPDIKKDTVIFEIKTARNIGEVDKIFKDNFGIDYVSGMKFKEIEGRTLGFNPATMDFVAVKDGQLEQGNLNVQADRDRLRDFVGKEIFDQFTKWANEQIQKLNEPKKSQPKGGGAQKTQVEQGEDKKQPRPDARNFGTFFTPSPAE